MTTFELSISPNNVPHWGIWEGCREFIQNALDQENSSVRIEGGALVCENSGELPSDYWITGNSTKRDSDSSRGSYGEGAKAAMCCLVRDGFDISIFDGGNKYNPQLGYSAQFDTEVIIIEKEEFCKGSDNKVEVIIPLSLSNIELVTKNALILQGDYEKLSVDKGDILLDSTQKGRVYVGGLYVLTESDLEYGYDFKPKYFKLDRDRNLARTYDIKVLTAKILTACEEAGMLDTRIVASNIKNGSGDMSYSECYGVNISNSVADACFDELAGNSEDPPIITGSQEESRKLKASGYQNVVYSSNAALVNAVKKSPKYKSIERAVEIKSPIQVLEEFRDTYLSGQSATVIAAFNAIIKLVTNLL